MLSEWLCLNRNTVRDKTVLEIGSGLVMISQLDPKPKSYAFRMMHVWL